jgi:penicillin-binding protein 2
VPTPSQPTEPPGTVGRRYLTAWAAGDFAAMYATLAPAAQARSSRDAFVNRYLAIKDEAGITKVTPTPAAGVPETATSLPYTVQIETHVGTVSEQGALPLVQADGRWGVDWAPTLIFKELKADRLVRFFPDNPIRGRILDRHGTVLAETGEAPVIGVIRAEIKNEAALLAGLSQKLGLDPETIKQRYTGGQADWWMPIKRLLADPGANWSRSSARPGHSRMRPERAYPRGWRPMSSAMSLRSRLKMSPRAASRTGRPGHVEAGVEKDRRARGRLMIVEKDGSPAVTLAQRKAKPGADVTLTLDLNIQRVAEAALGERRGAVVVLDPKDGAVLAMVSLPSFDPNQFILGLSDETWATLNDPIQRPLMNRTIDGIYPPGSIFKVVTMSAAMEKLGRRVASSSRAPAASVAEGAAGWSDWPGHESTGQGLTTSRHRLHDRSAADAIEDDGSPLARSRALRAGPADRPAELVEAAGNARRSLEDEPSRMSGHWRYDQLRDRSGLSAGDTAADGQYLRCHRQRRDTMSLVQRATLPGGRMRVAEPASVAGCRSSRRTWRRSKRA